MPQTRTSDDARYHVPIWLDLLGRLVEASPETWIRLGEWETERLRDQLPEGPIDRPVYVTGLARAGSTIMLELLSRHRDVATHRYRDFPMVHIPWFWNRFVDRTVSGPAKAHERAHGDGIEVTAESPEAFEEVLWMTFFPQLHDPSVSNVLGAEDHNPQFDAFYVDHLRKLMLLRGGRRYLAKANYDVTRIGYLLRLLPDARFVIPIRDPVTHVASLMRQHDLFRRVGREHPRARRHMRRAGHFEFGPDLRPINTGDQDAVVRIQRLWAAGQDVEGWARYWAMIYGHVADRMDADPAIRRATLPVRFEDLCRAPGNTMRQVLQHADLEEGDLPDVADRRIREPSYYRVPFTDDQQRLIRECTEETAARFGYGAAKAGIEAAAAGSA